MNFNPAADAEIQAVQVKVSYPNELENTGMARHVALDAIFKKLAYSLADSVMTITKTPVETEYSLTVYVLTPGQLEKLISDRVKA